MSSKIIWDDLILTVWPAYDPRAKNINQAWTSGTRMQWQWLEKLEQKNNKFKACLGKNEFKASLSN